MKDETEDMSKSALGKVKEAVGDSLARLPSLDDFMSMLSAEDSKLTSTTSAYNVYNKYNKTS